MRLLYSVGHSNHAIERFCCLLHNNQIQYLVDIRSVPHSKNHPQYNQKELMNALEAECVKYIFLGDELGGRIKDVTCYKNHTIPKSNVGYASFLDYDAIKTKDWFLFGIQKLLTIVDMGTCAIMCSEENPEKCHRELIVGRKLKEDGCSLIHIRANKDILPQLSLFE